MTTPELIALDWGTSSLRAFLMAKENVIESRASAHGIQHLPKPGILGFEQAFAAITQDWLKKWPHLPSVASGMVGSAQGWREAPYVTCPASIQTLANLGVKVDNGLGSPILIAPGVLFDVPNALPDVMRGEEIQIAGALLQHPEWGDRACMVLPGTHSKWVEIENGKIIRFSTYLTGELFSVLKTHSILGRLMPENSGDSDTEQSRAAFKLGLSCARQSAPGDLTQQIFATRTLGLTGRIEHHALADYLSGLLIGHELVSGLAMRASLNATPAPLVLIGDPRLCLRYAQCFSQFNETVAASLENTAPAGLWNFAQAANLL